MIGRITKLISNDYTVKTNENKYISQNPLPVI